MIARSSARKHGISTEDGIEAATWPLVSVPLDDEDPRRFLRLGFDTHGRLLELLVLVWDDESEELIHAMKCRPQYLELLA
ncbi:hypothetical protein NEK97_04570 [Paenarthrobacter sp. UW852]|uniref:hypothetical protein n=1 Tax=Paenarthrobacter sp. UW852 TaxID=2951989 RepID=UPI0021495E9B|nr:hypothetical protein [Paenarthrobacter sp. UW852]MCR1160729.1 hypothetical protein [Paenarthrobacter sp. UW852]